MGSDSRLCPHQTAGEERAASSPSNSRWGCCRAGPPLERGTGPLPCRPAPGAGNGAAAVPGCPDPGNSNLCVPFHTHLQENEAPNPEPQHKWPDFQKTFFLLPPARFTKTPVIFFLCVTKTQIHKDTAHRLVPNLDQIFSSEASLACDTKSVYTS